MLQPGHETPRKCSNKQKCGKFVMRCKTEGDRKIAIKSAALKIALMWMPSCSEDAIRRTSDLGIMQISTVSFVWWPNNE